MRRPSKVTAPPGAVPAGNNQPTAATSKSLASCLTTQLTPDATNN